MTHSAATMTLSDFSSVVQLGVGLHAGTALLQSVAELAGTPLSRRIERLKALAERKAARSSEYSECLDDAGDIIGTLELKKVQFFNEYKFVVRINGFVAVGLCILLSIIAFCADAEVPGWAGLLITAISYLPAGLSLLVLGARWSENTTDLTSRTADLERRLLGGIR